MVTLMTHSIYFWILLDAWTTAMHMYMSMQYWACIARACIMNIILHAHVINRAIRAVMLLHSLWSAYASHYYYICWCSVWQALQLCIDLTIPLYKWDQSSLKDNFYSAVKVDPMVIGYEFYVRVFYYYYYYYYCCCCCRRRYYYYWVLVARVLIILWSDDSCCFSWKFFYTVDFKTVYSFYFDRTCEWNYIVPI